MPGNFPPGRMGCGRKGQVTSELPAPLPNDRMYTAILAASLAISSIAVLLVMGWTADYLYHRRKAS